MNDVIYRNLGEAFVDLLTVIVVGMLVCFAIAYVVEMSGLVWHRLKENQRDKERSKGKRSRRR
jgi:hypothetical protein